MSKSCLGNSDWQLITGLDRNQPRTYMTEGGGGGGMRVTHPGSHVPPGVPSSTPRGTHTPIWEPLFYLMPHSVTLLGNNHWIYKYIPSLDMVESC